jgi:hypothetical protein
MKNFLLGTLLTGVVGLPTAGHAQDVGAIVAAFNDPQAECRYLAQKVSTQNEAISIVRELTVTHIQAMRAFNTARFGSKDQKEKQKFSALAEVYAERAGDLSLQAQAEVRAIEEVIQARRGSLAQCQEDLSQIPPPKEVAVPKDK